MKKLIALLLAFAMLACLFAGCGASTEKPTEADKSTDNTPEATDAPAAIGGAALPGAAGASTPIRVGLITTNDVVDGNPYNKSIQTAIQSWCDSNAAECARYSPSGDSAGARMDAISTAAAEGCCVVFLAGAPFGDSVAQAAGSYPDINFIALDVSADDLNPSVDTLPQNVYCANYKEEIAGYMAGYAAVKLGYINPGFLGGKPVPSVVRYGHGYVQGANDAAREMGIADSVKVNYIYCDHFDYNEDDVLDHAEALLDNGVDVAFVCGGAICRAAVDPLTLNGVEIIGVDMDQQADIDAEFGAGTTLTSAMKGLDLTVRNVLTDIAAGSWSKYGGRIDSLGLVSENSEENYVRLAPSTAFNKHKFSRSDYEFLVSDILDGYVVVSDDISRMPETEITVNVLELP